jgi:O-antigen/teichoic acid export membrane protein
MANAAGHEHALSEAEELVAAETARWGPEAETSAASETAGSQVVGAGLWATSSRLLTQFYSLLMSIVAARFLGPDGMGRQSLIAFAAIFATTAMALGVPTAVMRYVGERIGAGESETLPKLVRSVWRVEAIAAAVGAVGLIAIGVSGAEPRAAWILAGFTCAFGVLQEVPSSVLVGMQRWRDVSSITIVMGGVAMVLTIVVLAAGGGVTAMIAVGTASTLVILLWTTARMRRRVRALTTKPRLDPQLHRDVWRWAGIASLGVPITLIVWFRSEFFFLAHYSTDKEIALYSIAFAASTAVAIIPLGLAKAIAPAFATLYGAGAIERIKNGFGRSMRLLLTATLPITAVAIALGPETLRIIYGNEYRGTATPLTIMLLLLPFLALLHTSVSLLDGLGRQWFPLTFGAIAAVVNLGLAFLLIPRYDAVGAATASALGQLTAALPMIGYAIWCVRGMQWDGWALLRAGVAAAAAGLAAAGVLQALGGGLGIAVGIVAWVVVLGVLARILRIVSRLDAAWLDDVVRTKLARLRKSSPNPQPLPVPGTRDTGA